MTRKRKWALGIGAMVLAMAGYVAVRLLFYPCPITPENHQKIQPGMTLQQVGALLGRPADGKFNVVVPITDGTSSTIWFAEWTRTWTGEAAVISVMVDDNGVIALTNFTPLPRPSLWQRIRSWIW
ncbi:MAG: outer membrane protein assembly factor BamE [Gemmataceae bacterium]|nr:outer membrane protein assembly factor BamE [Gemmataceae bacterium]MCI0740253.1 outer membrane protein assembly factor BamE [Gemmataceae bacterium]